MNNMTNIVKMNPAGSAVSAEEIRLIDLAREGDREAFSRVYDLHKDGLFRYALYRLGSPEDAQDAVQECVLAAFKQIGQLRSSEAFRGWIYKILSACCSRLIRGSVIRREKDEKLKEQVSSERIGDPQQMTVESLVLNQALGRLDQLSRDIVLLSVVGGFSSAEVSELTGIRPGSVRSRLSRGLKKMRDYLEEQDEQRA